MNSIRDTYKVISIVYYSKLIVVIVSSVDLHRWRGKKFLFCHFLSCPSPSSFSSLFFFFFFFYTFGCCHSFYPSLFLFFFYCCFLSSWIKKTKKHQVSILMSIKISWSQCVIVYFYYYIGSSISKNNIFNFNNLIIRRILFLMILIDKYYVRY